MKKKLTALLAAALLVVCVAGLYAAATDNTVPDTANTEPVPYFRAVGGVVTAVSEYYGINDTAVPEWFFISIEDSEGAPATLLVNGDTFYPYEREISVGDFVTGYYQSDRPMIMIYPPQYPVSVLVSGAPDSETVTADRFTRNEDGPEGELISDGGMLAISIGENTIVTDTMGAQFTGELDGRKLVVIYDVSTRSIPARTTPLSVTVLPEDETEAPSEETPVSEGTQIIVNGTEIDAPVAFDDNGTIMIPLRAIAEALGFTVSWDGQTSTVSLGDSITLAIGQEQCQNGDMVFTISPAPMLVDGRTFVPLRFFKDVAGMNNAYFFENQIVIDRDGEIME